MEQPDEVRSKSRLLFWCLNANIGAFVSGIFFTAFNACLFQVLTALKTSTEDQNLTIAALTAMIPLGGIAGGIVFGLLSVKAGRRRLLIAIDIITIISCTISQSTFYALMLVGRALCGFVCGANFMMVPLYVREMLPQHFSKRTAVMFRGMFTLGACFSFFIGYFSQEPPTEPNTVWVGVFMMPVAFAVIRMALLAFVVKMDTPTFYIKNGDNDNAWKVINKIYSDNYLDGAYRRERRYATHFKFSDILSYEYRGQVRLALLLVIFTQLMGGNLLNFYSTLVLFRIRPGVTEQDYSDVGFLNLVTSFIAFFSSLFGNLMLDKFGKRPLLVYGAFSLFVLSFCITFSELSSFIVGQATLIIVFAAVQNMTFNLVSSAFVYELLPSYSIVLQVVFEMLGMLGTVFVFPLIALELNFVITGIMSLIGFFVVFKMVKETKGMTSDEIHKLFQAQTRGLLDDEVTISPSKLTPSDDLQENVYGERLDLSQSKERQFPVY